MRSRAGEWLGHTLLVLCAWVAFTQRVAPSELAAGAAASAVAGVASQLVWSHNGASFRGAGRWLWQVWRLPRHVVTGTGEILSVLVRHLAGRPAPSLLLWARFDAGGPDPRSQARRALAIAYTTMAPNFIVLGVDARRGRLWYHQVRRGPVPPMTVALGASP